MGPGQGLCRSTWRSTRHSLWGATWTHLDQACCRVPPLLKVLLTVLLLNLQGKARPQNALQVTGVRRCPRDHSPTLSSSGSDHVRGTTPPPHPCLHTSGSTFLPPQPPMPGDRLGGKTWIWGEGSFRLPGAWRGPLGTHLGPEINPPPRFVHTGVSAGVWPGVTEKGHREDSIASPAPAAAGRGLTGPLPLLKET